MNKFLFFIILLSITQKVISIHTFLFINNFINYLVFILSIFYLFSNHYKLKKVNITTRNIIISFVVYHSYWIITSILSINTEASFVYFLFNFPLLLLFLHIQNKKLYYSLLKFFTIILSFSLIYGLLIHFIGEPFSSLRLMILNNDKISYMGKGSRIVGFSTSIFEFGYALAALPILLLVFYYNEGNVIYVWLFLLSILGILLNGERSTLLSASICLIPFIKWFNFKKIVLILIIAGLVIILLLFYNYKLHEDNTINRLSEIDNESRIMKQYFGFKSVLAHPFSGDRIDTYYHQYWNWYNWTPSNTHNSYINMGMDIGIVGWLILIFFLYNTHFIIQKVRSKKEVLYKGIIYAFLAVMMNGFFHNAGIFNHDSISLILLGFLIAANRIENNKEFVNVKR